MSMMKREFSELVRTPEMPRGFALWGASEHDVRKYLKEKLKGRPYSLKKVGTSYQGYGRYVARLTDDRQ